MFKYHNNQTNLNNNCNCNNRPYQTQYPGPSPRKPGRPRVRKTNQRIHWLEQPTALPKALQGQLLNFCHWTPPGKTRADNDSNNLHHFGNRVHSGGTPVQLPTACNHRQGSTHNNPTTMHLWQSFQKHSPAAASSYLDNMIESKQFVQKTIETGLEQAKIKNFHIPLFLNMFFFLNQKKNWPNGTG